MPCTQTVTGHFHFTDLAYLVAEESHLTTNLFPQLDYSTCLSPRTFVHKKIPITTFGVTGI